MNTALTVKKPIDWISYSIIFIFITVIFHIIYGLEILLPGNINWLMAVRGDWGGYYLGWVFYRDEPWTLPLGYLQSYGYPVDHNVAMTDGIPVLSIIPKIFSFLLPRDFQLYGLWMLSCHLLTAHFSFKIFKLFNVPKIVAVTGAILVALNPVLITRGMHCPLAAHWLLLASMYNYLRPTDQTNMYRVNYNQAFILLFSTVTNIYLAVMVAGISAIIPLKQKYFDKSLSLKQAIVIPGLYMMVVLVAWLAVGIIAFGGVTAHFAAEFGPFSTNLNSFFNSFGMSNILPGFKVFNPEQGEGYAYLGFGFILLVAINFFYFGIKNSYFTIERLKSSYFIFPLFIALLAFIQGLTILGIGMFIWASIALMMQNSDELRSSLMRYAYLAPLGILGVAYFLFALSHQPTFFDKKIFSIPLPMLVEKGASMFRGNGRFVWLLYYLILTSSVVLFARIRLSKQMLTFAFLGIAIIEMYDIIPCMLQYKKILAPAGTYKTPLKDDAWESLMSHFDAVITYPPNTKTILNDMDYQDLAFLASRVKKPISVGYYSRNSTEANEQFQNRIVSQINEGKIEKNYLFVTTKEHVSVFKNLINSKTYDLQSLDNYWLVFLKDKQIPYSVFETDGNARRELDSLMNAPNQVIFTNGILSDKRVVIPIWGAGWVSANPFEMKKGNYLLKFTAFSTPADNEYAKIEMAVNGEVIGEFATDGAPAEFEVHYVCKSDLQATISVRLTNDANIPGKGDRNAFIEKFVVVPDTSKIP